MLQKVIQMKHSKMSKSSKGNEIGYIVGRKREYTERDIARYIRFLSDGFTESEMSRAGLENVMTTRPEIQENKRKSNKNSSLKTIGVDKCKSKCKFCFKVFKSGRGLKTHERTCQIVIRDSNKLTF